MFNLEKRGSMFIQNIRELTQDYMASHHKKVLFNQITLSRIFNEICKSVYMNMLECFEATVCVFRPGS
jgi:hypothetical protein